MEDVHDERLDDLILAQSRQRQLKVARIFGLVLQQCEADGWVVGEEKLNERLRYLVNAGKLEAFGDIANWRFSEVKLRT